MTRKTPAAEQFAALGIAETDWTDPMRLAVKQKWSGLPVDQNVSDLRDAIAAVTQAPVADASEVKAELVLAGAQVVSDADVATEVKRRKRNAAVNAWRERNQLQAALDARELKFAKMRQKRNKGTGKSAPPADPSAAASPLAAAS